MSILSNGSFFSFLDALWNNRKKMEKIQTGFWETCPSSTTLVWWGKKGYTWIDAQTKGKKVEQQRQRQRQRWWQQFMFEIRQSNILTAEYVHGNFAQNKTNDWMENKYAKHREKTQKQFSKKKHMKMMYTSYKI